MVSESNAISIAEKGGSNHVVDNLRSSFDSLAIGFGIQLHSGWIHSLVAGAGTGRPVN